MERFKIFPSIGIARVGGSLNQFYLCPESNNSLGVEFDNSGNENEVKNFKDASGLIKRQGARFKVYELNSATGEYKPVDMNLVSIKWTVHLVNKKAGVTRQGPPATPPNIPLPLRPNSQELIIDSGEKQISGVNQNGVALKGKYKTNTVDLGELRTDNNGNLIVLGGAGISKSPTNQPIANFYYSNDWYDDTSDGFIKASVKLEDGREVQALEAWVIVAPPDYAPNVKGVVTLYDIMEQVAISNGQLQQVQVPSFTNHVLPIIERFKNIKWVSGVLDAFPITESKSVLADTATTNLPTRRGVRNKILRIETALDSFELTQYQKDILEKWVNGNFTNDLSNPIPSLKSADQLNKDVLDTTVGQGFYPGIEGGIIVKNPNLYIEPFRFDSTKVVAGDISGLMALPWQADFLKCRVNWWPTQRPDRVKLSNGTDADWQRGIPNGGHQLLINNFNKLGFIKPKNGEQIEDERTL
ncbi:LodA/GoxA family CTQ-dependent oxidase [Persicitalea jodogahamensis]|uniref:3-isopropylmalate dehydrogenase n=1 Tax=Persicitalea jodogahamensis TaxID=402147 RepID=A0A8J3D728_9BACT|nr:LodA/GoxA family CTQ-dependent oxidase [Persicitalea jodogahamensis]GHB62640.1 3-isopropylmalate dehydrogenase [Persicitalea jodogahamensis]